jgi:HEAT repeat protein
MSRVRDIYKQLRNVDDPTIDRAMAAALPTADPKAVHIIALSLLERQRPEGLLPLVERYHLMPEQIRTTIVRHVADLYRPLREAAAGGDRRARLNVIEIIALARATRLAYLLTEQLRHRDKKVAHAAAARLVELAEAACTQRDGARDAGPPPINADNAQYLITAVVHAVETYAAHARDEALHALLLLAPRTIEQTNELFEGRPTPRREAMRLMIERAADPHVCRAMLWLMQVPALTEPALAGIRTAFARDAVGPMAQQTVGHILTMTHLLLDHRAAKILARPQYAKLPLPDADTIDALGPAATRGLPRWIAALPIDAAAKVQRLAALVGSSDTPTRLAALRGLMALHDHPKATGVSTMIADFCYDADPQLVRIALRFLSCRKWDGCVNLLMKLVNSPHPEIRAIAGEELAPLGFERLWSAWTRLTPAKQLAAGRALIKIDANFHRMLGAKLSQSDRGVRMTALSIIYRLNQGTFFTGALEALAKDEDERVASAAVRALGTADGQGATDALRDALDHPDSRVRANAVESLFEIDASQHIDKLMQMARDDDNRPRANAIGALLNMHVSEAVDALKQMIHDPRSEQRISALWLIQRMELIELAQQVAEMSISDPDAKTRQRAGHVIQQIIRSLEGAPSESADAQAPETAT